MRSWLIHLFKGATKEEYLQLNIEYNAQREFTSIYRARVDSLEAQLLAERTERKFLQDLIFKRFGVLISEDSPQEQGENLRPISNGPTRWSSLRNKLEQDDHQRVQGQTGKYEEKTSA
jgi:hypothetical protein